MKTEKERRRSETIIKSFAALFNTSWVPGISPEKYLPEKYLKSN